MGDVLLESGSLYYTGLELDRAGMRRSDPVWMQAQQDRPDLSLIPLWSDNCLVQAGRPVVLTADQARPLMTEDAVFLGLSAGRPVFAADLSGQDREVALAMTGAQDATDVRALIGAVSRAEAGLLAYARGLLHWQRRQRFCGSCGGPCEPRDGGHVRACAECGTLHFPKIEPAIIVLVELPGEPRRCLLGRHQGAGPGRYSTLAGFVEVGEGLEDAVRREVAEEAGVTVGAVHYQGSQAWPFPAGIMIGFRGVAESADIAVDQAELTDARWFTGAEVRARIADTAAVPPYRHDSIGRALIESWLAESADHAETCG
jgi:NAD+ diphosphatase